jgi:hypothetical protein
LEYTVGEATYEFWEFFFSLFSGEQRCRCRPACTYLNSLGITLVKELAIYSFVVIVGLGAEGDLVSLGNYLLILGCLGKEKRKETKMWLYYILDCPKLGFPVSKIAIKLLFTWNS